MELRVLGSLEVESGGVTLPLGTRKQQVVLAVLALHPNRVVSPEKLLDELWPAGPPASGLANLRSYAAALRRLFDSVGEPDRLVRQDSGYVLRANAHELDLIAFEEAAGWVRRAVEAGRYEDASRWFAEALRLWRGPLLPGLARGPLLASRCAAIEEERRKLVEAYARVSLRAGEWAEAITILSELVSTYPLRESAWALLMRAYYLSGDPAAALRAYADVRTHLVGQLGVEPSPTLRELHRAVLNHDLEPEFRPPPTPTPALVVPRELPPEAAWFVGRDTAAEELSTVLARRHGPASQRPTLVVVYGPGGIGKSALAVHVGHRVAGDFPDGQLYVDMQGSTPGLRPLSVLEVLGRFLRGLGVPADEIPTDEAWALSKYRTVTAGRRLLVVLDNVTDVAQVAPLLPANGRCGVMITSRTPLATLESDRHLRLEGLLPEAALVLVQRLTPGLEVEHEVAATIAARCDYLPLAIRIAAARLVGRPDLPPQELAERLTDGRRRLDELEVDGLAVRSCLRIGYEALASSPSPLDLLAIRALRVLALLNVPDVQAEVVAAMLDSYDATRVRVALDRLVASQLVEGTVGGRYRMHDLVRLFAMELATEQDSPDDRSTALRRGLAYYLGSAQRADDLLRPGRRTPLASGIEQPTVRLAELSTLPDALAWIHGELANLLAAAEQAAELSGADRAFPLLLCNAIWHRLYSRLEWRRALRLAHLALAAAEYLQDRDSIAHGHLLLGRTQAEVGDFTAATYHHEQALDAFRRLGAHRGVALALNGLGVTAEHTGDAEAALDHFKCCLAVAQEHELRTLVDTALVNMGSAYVTLGRWSDAKQWFDRCLKIRQERGDRHGLTSALLNLSAVHCHLGAGTEAIRLAMEAAQLAGELGDEGRRTKCVLVVVEVYLRSKEADRALGLIQEALVFARTTSHHYAEARLLHQRSRAFTTLGRDAQATAAVAESETVLANRSVHGDTVLDALVLDRPRSVPDRVLRA